MITKSDLAGEADQKTTNPGTLMLSFGKALLSEQAHAYSVACYPLQSCLALHRSVARPELRQVLNLGTCCICCGVGQACGLQLGNLVVLPSQKLSLGQPDKQDPSDEVRRG